MSSLNQRYTYVVMTPMQLRRADQAAARLLMLEVKVQLEVIRQAAETGDNHLAHDLEIALHRKVLHAVSRASNSAAYLLVPIAQKALESIKVPL